MGRLGQICIFMGPRMLLGVLNPKGDCQVCWGVSLPSLFPPFTCGPSSPHLLLSHSFSVHLYFVPLSPPSPFLFHSIPFFLLPVFFFFLLPLFPVTCVSFPSRLFLFHLLSVALYFLPLSPPSPFSPPFNSFFLLPVLLSPLFPVTCSSIPFHLFLLLFFSVHHFLLLFYLTLLFSFPLNSACFFYLCSDLPFTCALYLCLFPTSYIPAPFVLCSFVFCSSFTSLSFSLSLNSFLSYQCYFLLLSSLPVSLHHFIGSCSVRSLVLSLLFLFHFLSFFSFPELLIFLTRVLFFSYPRYPCLCLPSFALALFVLCSFLF